MFKLITNEDFLKKLKDLNVRHIPLEEYKGSSVKIKWMCYKNPRHIFEASPDSVYRNAKNNVDGCMYCNHQKVFVGETDMWTTRPDMAKMLLNPEDGYIYFATTNKKLDWICPNCGNIVRGKTPHNVSKQGLSCQFCSDGISFGEKFVRELLSQLKCDFIHDRPTDWSEGKRYDFYIPIMSIIIETHGLQHYKDSFTRYSNSNRRARTVKEEEQNDKYKRNLALSNNIEHYIQLDCRMSDGDYIKNSIINSDLNELFDLSDIDWNKCLQSTFDSDVIICSDLWNNGMKRVKDISDYTGIDRCSVVSYLKRATKIGLCNFEPNYIANQVSSKNLVVVVSLLDSGITSVSQLMKMSGLSNSTVYKMLKRANLYTDRQLAKQNK